MPNNGKGADRAGSLLDKVKSEITLKELVTTLISLSIIFLGLWMIREMFEVARTGKTENVKEPFLYMWALMGPVVGYYFGRVPAEIRADRTDQALQQSQQTAHAAIQQAAEATSAASAAASEREALRRRAVRADGELGKLVDDVSVPEAGSVPEHLVAIRRAREAVRQIYSE